MPNNRIIASTPRGTVLTVGGPGLQVRARLDWNDHIRRFNQGYSRAQVWLDNAVLRNSTPYVAKLTGALQLTGILGTTPGEGTVQWIAPYSRYIYYGKVVKGPKYGPKYATGKDLHINQSENPRAQPFWFEVAKAQNKSIWIQGVRRIAGGG